MYSEERPSASGTTEDYYGAGDKHSEEEERRLRKEKKNEAVGSATSSVSASSPGRCHEQKEEEIVQSCTFVLPSLCRRKRTAMEVISRINHIVESAKAEEPPRSSGRSDEVGGKSSEAQEASQPSSMARPVEKKKNKKKRRRSAEGARVANMPGEERQATPLKPEEMPQEMREHIESKLEGTDIGPVCQRQLTSTDVAPSKMRVFLPKGDFASFDFLNHKEMEQVSRPSTRGKKTGISVQVLGPNREKYDLTFARWNVGGNKSTMYVLTKAHWAKLVEDNNLKTKDVIQVWSFRVGSKLHMAIVAVDP